jgi:hypothetical protein
MFVHLGQLNLPHILPYPRLEEVPRGQIEGELRSPRCDWSEVTGEGKVNTLERFG